MKSTVTSLVSLLAAPFVHGADPVYTNYIWQTQLPSTVRWDATDTVGPSGSQQSQLAINPGGARFDLVTYKSQAPAATVEYILDTSYVGSSVPLAQMVVDTEDSFGKDLTATGPVPKNLPAVVRRTRADRPFKIYFTVSGLATGISDDPEVKSVTLTRHVQSYGAGTSATIDPTQATLSSQALVSTNGSQILSYALTAIPGSDLAKLRGQERFTIWTLEDKRVTPVIPATKLASQTVEIWPVADGSITGITQNQLIRFAMPSITLKYNDIYPGGTAYTQVYRGNQALGTVGTVISGSTRVNTESFPMNQLLTVSNYDSALDGDGRWTMEILTNTPFGIDRLAWVSFDLDRTLEVHGMLSDSE
jgi:hypothetical protein